MKFFRRPMPRLPARETGPLLTWDRMRFYLLGLALMLMAFLVGLYIFFPTEVLKERVAREVARETGVDVRIGSLALLFPPGVQADNVSVPLSLPGRTALDIDSTRVQPLWLTFFSGNPGAAFQARLLGGKITGRARRDGSLEMQAEQLAFSQELAVGSALNLAGALDEGSFTGNLPPTGTNESRIELLFTDLRIEGLEALGVADGNLRLGRLICKGVARGNNLRIEQLESSGGEMLVTGSGSLMLNQPVERSRLNLNLSLRPGSNFDRNLRDLLDLFATPGRDGSYSLRLSGTLATPVFAK